MIRIKKFKMSTLLSPTTYVDFTQACFANNPNPQQAQLSMCETSCTSFVCANECMKKYPNEKPYRCIDKYLNGYNEWKNNYSDGNGVANIYSANKNLN